jgi:hypothetical protein
MRKTTIIINSIINSVNKKNAWGVFPAGWVVAGFYANLPDFPSVH